MAKKKQRKDGLVYSTNSEFFNDREEEERETTPPADQDLCIQLDKKHRGGKTVTLITGWELQDQELTQLAGQLKNHCGTGGSGKNYEVILQGDHRNKAGKWLKNHGYTRCRIK